LGAYGLWDELTSAPWQVDKPIHEAGAYKRVFDPVVTLFTPWGPPYQNRGLDIARGPEVAIIKRLVEIEKLFDGYKRRPIWHFLGADAYGTQVNQKNGKSRVNPKTASQYFAQLEALLKRNLGQCYFHLWSGIRSEASPTMMSFWKELTDDFVTELVGLELLDEARETARAVNGLRHRNEAQPIAIEYLRQRIFEAEMVEELWHPIKISLAPPHKDRVVDGVLPILYLVPEELRTPWLK